MRFAPLLRNTLFLMLAGVLVFSPAPRPALAQATAIIGVVFADGNGNGVRDPGESGMANVTLTCASGSNTMNSVTNQDGSYLCTVDLGTWSVTVFPSAGLQAVGAGTQSVSITAPGQNVTADFGLRPILLSTSTPLPPPAPTKTPGVLPQTGAAIPGSRVLLLALIAIFVGGAALLISAWAPARK